MLLQRIAMKVPLGVLIVCLILCYASSVSGFKDGKKYIYEYTAVYGSGVSDEEVTQFAGHGMKAQLHVYHTNNHLAVELHDMKSADFNSRLVSVSEVLNLDYQAPTDAEEIKVLAEYEKPWYGEYGTDGKIVASKHTTLKENVHTNFQRAILSLLQVVLPSDHVPTTLDHNYTVEESVIGGDCQTSYNIYTLPEEGLNVFKHYNYDQCTYHPYHLFSSLIGYQCKHCGRENFKEYVNVGRVEYEMKGNIQDYTIKKIYATGHTSYTPFTPNGQTAMSITNQTLHLIKVEDVNAAAVPGDAKRIEGLYFQFHAEEHDYDTENLKENHFADRVFPAKYVKNRFDGEKDHIAQASSLLPLIVGNHGGGPSKKWFGFHHSAQITDRLEQVLFTFDYSDFEKFFAQNIKLDSDEPKERDLKNYVMKMMSIVGTNPSILFALDQIRTGKIPEKIEVEIIGTLPIYVKTPSKPLVEEFRKFVKSDQVNKDHEKSMFSVAWEAYGSLIYRACVKHIYNNHPARKETFVDKEHCKEYVEDILDHLKSVDKWNDKCMLTRALINTRSEEGYRYLMDELIPVSGQKYNEYIRSTAISGLKHFVDSGERGKEISAVLLPIFTNIHEDYQLRIYAFNVIIHIHQLPGFYSNLLTSINEEPNRQVASYVWSTLSSIVNTTDPCYQHIAKHAKTILPYIIHKNYDYDFLRHSTNKILFFYNEKYGFGRTSQMTMIGGNDTAVPREVYFREAMNLAGHNFDFLEVGGIQRNNHALDNILAAALKQFNLMMAPKMGDKDFHVAKHMNLEKFLSNMTSEIYSRIFNQETAVVYDQLQFSAENAYSKKVGDNEFDVHYINVMHAAQIEHVRPNMLGFPVCLQLFSPTVTRLDGVIEYKADRNGTVPTVTINTDFQFGIDLNVQARILVENPCTGASGYQLQTDAGFQIPLHGEYSLEKHSFEKYQVRIKKFVSEDDDVVYYDTQPTTFMQNHHSVPVEYSDKPVQHNYKFGHDYFGAGLYLNFTYDHNGIDYDCYQTFFKTIFDKSTEGYNNLMNKFYAGSQGFIDYAIFNPKARPFHFHVRVEHSSSHPTTEVLSTYTNHKSDFYDEGKSNDTHAISTKKHKLEIVAKGPSERKWNMELEVDRHWPLVDFSSLIFHWKRSPIPNHDDKPQEICFKSDTKIHGREEIIMNPLNPAKEAKMEFEGTLNDGEDCAAGSGQVTFKGELTKSQEHRDIDQKIYQQCKDDVSNDYDFSHSCWLVKKDQGRLDHLRLDVTYDKNVNPNVKEFFNYLYSWFQDTKVTENHVRVEANISSYQAISILGESCDAYLKRALGLKLKKPKCFLSSDYVRTLDDVTYKYKLGKCYQVAVANCLRENVVLMYKTVDDSKYSMAMKLVVDSHHVEIKPEGDKLVAYVDGSKVLEGNKHAHILKEKHLLAVYRKFKGYVVKARTSGLKVYFDGKNSKIWVSNLFHGVQCGMCGDFNNEALGEYRHVDGTLYKNGSEFAQSYAIHTPDCDQ